MTTSELHDWLKVEFREQRDNDGRLYLYVTTSEGIEVTVERYELLEENR